MADFAYTTVPGKITPLLQKIREIGIPAKVSVKWLKTIGFTSSSDTTLIQVLKQVGFVDASGIPGTTWSEYRGAKHKEVLGDAIRIGYEKLFKVYPDAGQRNSNELEHVFSTSSTAGKQVIGKTVSTFKSLCESAVFTATANKVGTRTSVENIHESNQVRGERSYQSGGSNTPSVHIDIQVHIAPESSPEQIEQIFKSMAKHLYGKGDA
jgi:hypothetical protein